MSAVPGLRTVMMSVMAMLTMLTLLGLGAVVIC
jgi:hypothetical protein